MLNKKMDAMKSPIIEYKLTQSDLAKAICCSQSYVSRLLRGKVKNQKKLQELKAIIKQKKAA
jgi:predicted transcriptional regulator